MELVEQARQLLATNQPSEALKLIKPVSKEQVPQVQQLLGEIYLEMGKTEKAFKHLSQACELDPQGAAGTEKFMYLGQIIGGRQGLQLMDVGLQNATEVSKINQAIFAKIEIWMTDLCMEPEAEAECDALIHKSLELDPANPEAWSLLASIRISQQRNEEAQQAIERSAELFLQKKTALEDSATAESVEIDTSAEYVELLQPLLTLSRLALECGLYPLGATIASQIRDINEDNIESFYLEGFAVYLQLKKLQHTGEGDFQETQLDLASLPADLLRGALLPLTLAYKILSRVGCPEDTDPEIPMGIEALINELGGPLPDEELVEGDEMEAEEELENY